ncbi:MAG: CotH kinase family protein [Clostridia bacterium]|nr:CotH kinase family protein [Clostridia bacterium]
MKKNTRLTLGILLVLTFIGLLLMTGCDKLPFLGSNSGEPEHKHTIEQRDGKEPTCTEGGWSPYELCVTCDDYTTYQELEPLGHDYSLSFSSDGDAHSRECILCGDRTDEGPHNWVPSGVIKAPTCTEEGEEAFTCITCRDTKLETVPPTDHTYSDFSPKGDVHVRSCISCGVEEEAEHSWEIKDNVDPTCEGEGRVTYSCSVCGSERSEIKAPAGHDYSAGYQPDGDIHKLVCSACGNVKPDSEAEHDWQAGEIISEPTCLKEGSQKYSCSACGAEKTVSLPAIEEHSWQANAITKEPTCVDEGVQNYICKFCGANKTEPIPATGEHFDGEWETTRYPTATVDGLKVLHCAVCSTVIAEEAIAADVKDMPIVYLTGDYTAATNAKNEVEMQVSYYDPKGEDSFDAYATIKVQGSSSTAYPKKNYTIKFYKDETFDKKLKIDFGWGNESKYVMKANWVDFIQARNVVSCRLWGDIVLSRNPSAIQERLAALPTNGGAIDGFPIAVFMNGNFHGIYTMNVPKDEWMFGMDDSETEALLGADNWNNTNFANTIGYFEEDSSGDLVTAGWELKYCGSDDTTWVTDSFNALIKFCQENEGEAFRAGAAEHLDVDAAIDYLILMYVNFMRDNASKNMLWATFDGKVWIPSVYDQDGVFGQVWDGVRIAEANKSLPGVKNGKVTHGFNFGPSAEYTYNGEYFILWDRIWNAYTEEVLVRYKELRETTLSEENIIAEFEAFRACIPVSVYQADIDRWATERATWWQGKKGSGVWYEKFNYDYTYDWISERLDYLDEAMGVVYNDIYLPSTSDPII